jgi:hypothetical protein
MKRFLLCFIVLILLAVGLNAQVSWHSTTQTPSVSFNQPSNNNVYNLSINNSTYPVSWGVDCYPGPSLAVFKFEYNIDGNTYTDTYDYDGSLLQAQMPGTLYLAPKAYTLTVTVKRGAEGTWWTESSASTSFTVQPTLTVENSYGSGSVIVNGTTRTSGYVFNPVPGSSVSLAAIDRPLVGNYVRTFRSWSCDYTSPGSGISVSVQAPATNHGNATANFKKLYNVTFEANISGYFTVGSGSQSAPYTAETMETTTTSTVTAYNQSAGASLWGTFIKWNDGSTAASKTITPTDHITYTAYYRIKPTNDYRQLMFNSTIGDPITLTWSEHPSSDVGSYNIYRRLYAESTPTLIATVSRGTTTYVDYDYIVTENTGLNSRIFYDVRAVYSGTLPDNTSYTTEADANAQMQFGAPDAAVIKEKEVVAAKNPEGLSAAPTEYTLGSYPNPFNPTTVIRYTMPEAGQVSLKVYNILSQEVANLVESNQPAGVHQVNFNASHLPTGIYIARLQAGAKVMTAKLQLVK